GLRLDRWRELAGVHDQAVYLDEPDHRARVDNVLAQELLRAVVHLRQVTDLLGLGAQRGLGDTECRAQIIRGRIRLGGGIEQEVDLPQRVDDGARPGGRPARLDGRRALAGQLGDHAPGEPRVLLVQEFGTY